MTVGIEKKYKGKLTNDQFRAIPKTECVEIWKCDKPRACGWRGLHMHLIEGKTKGIETSLVCPECGHDVFETEYMDTSKARDKYIKKR